MTEIEMKEKERIWSRLLVFIISELFGDQAMIGGDTTSNPIEEGEKVLNIKLEEHEKMFYDCIDTVFRYLEGNFRKLPVGELTEKKHAAIALSKLFWCFLRLNHPELQDYEGIGIREGYRIVTFSSISKKRGILDLLEDLLEQRDN